MFIESYPLISHSRLSLALGVDWESMFFPM